MGSIEQEYAPDDNHRYTIKSPFGHKIWLNEHAPDNNHHTVRPLSGRSRRCALYYTNHWTTRIDGRTDASLTVLNLAKSSSQFELESTDRWHDCQTTVVQDGRWTI